MSELQTTKPEEGSVRNVSPAPVRCRAPNTGGKHEWVVCYERFIHGEWVPCEQARLTQSEANALIEKLSQTDKREPT